MSKVKVSDYVASYIESLKVKHVFTVSGAGNLHLLDSIEQNKNIEIICNHHEQASAMAMESYSRCSENFGICVVTFGPGCTNAITGVAGAWMDSIPCLTISGQCKLSDTIQNTGLRQKGIQEINIVKMIEPITKYAAMVEDAEDIRFHLEKAIYLAHKGRPGPVWIDIPMDIQAKLIDPNQIRSFKPDNIDPKDSFSYIKSNFEDLITKLKNATRPVLLLGNGVRLAGAANKVEELITKFKIPVLTTWNGADLLNSNSDYFIGRPGTYGQRGANFSLQNSDFLLTIGARMSVPQTGYVMDEFAREAYKAAVDIDRNELDKYAQHFDFACQGDARQFINKLLETNYTFQDSENWLKFSKSAYDNLPSCEKKYYDNKERVNSYAFVEELSSKLKGNETVITDMGTSFTCVHQTIKLKKGHRFYTSSGLASMGYALPAAIGASLARKEQVICLVGDGAFQMNLQELSIIKHLNLPIKIIVFNNNGYLTIRQTQDSLFNSKYIASSNQYGVHIPDTKEIAKAFELDFISTDKVDDLDKLLSRFLDTSKPSILEILMPTDQLLVPKSSVSQNKQGELISRPLEDLYPFLPRSTFNKYMLIKPLPVSEE